MSTDNQKNEGFTSGFEITSDKYGIAEYKGGPVTELVFPDGANTYDGNYLYGIDDTLETMVFPKSIRRFWCIIPKSVRRLKVANLQQLKNMTEECTGGYSYLAYIMDDNVRLAYSAKTRNCNLDGYGRKGFWGIYDSELINNGPKYKYKTDVRAFGAINRLVSPIELTNENKNKYIEFLSKNAKAVIPLAEYDKDTRYIQVMIDEGIINSSNRSKIKKLIQASIVPEIAAMASELDGAVMSSPKKETVDDGKGTPIPKAKKKIHVKVQFPDGKKYSYLCFFDVSVGDTVYVSGQKADVPGVVCEIMPSLPKGTALQYTQDVVSAYRKTDSGDK